MCEKRTEVAVEVHQNQAYGNDMSFDLRLTVRPPA